MKAYETDLVVSLYREGNYSEAKERIGEGLSQSSQVDEIVCLVNELANIETDLKNYSEALNKRLSVRELVGQCKDEFTIANYHFGLALNSKQIADEGNESFYDRALIEYEAARFFFEQAGREERLGFVENNIGSLLIKLGRADESHSHFESARQIISKLKLDNWPARLAEIDDTEALAYEAEGNYSQAVLYACRSVQALSQTDEPKTLINSKRTLERVLLKLEHDLTGWALREAKGSIPKAADLLSISRQGFAHKLKNSKSYQDLLSLAEFQESRGMHKV